MTYAELCANIQEIMETSFEANQLALFTETSEKKIYMAVHLPAMQKISTVALSPTNPLYTLPSDFIYPVYFSVVAAGGDTTFLLEKDVSFIRDAYPNATSTGTPKHYAILSDTQLLLGPTPSATVTAVSFMYAYYPESIVTASTTWLGDKFPNVLLNSCLIEAARFQKAEADIIANYEKLYLESLIAIKNLGDGKLQQDIYRSGNVRTKVS
jgi:hypothetical protein